MDDQFKRLELLKKQAEFLKSFNYSRLLGSLFNIKGLSLPVVCMVFDMQNLLIQDITDNCKEIWGWTKQEMEWRDIREMIHPDDLTKSVELAGESIIIDGMVISSYKNRHIAKGGNIVYLKWTTTETFNYQTLCFIQQITKEEFETK